MRPALTRREAIPFVELLSLLVAMFLEPFVPSPGGQTQPTRSHKHYRDRAERTENEREEDHDSPSLIAALSASKFRKSSPLNKCSCGAALSK
jgi:hypothetical protein